MLPCLQEFKALIILSVSVRTERKRRKEGTEKKMRDVVLILYEEDPLGKKMATHPSTLVWPAIVHGVAEGQM